MENLKFTKLALVNSNGDIIDTPVDTNITLTDLYDLLESSVIDKLVLDYFKEYGLVTAPSSAFVLSFVEHRPLFDGSAVGQEVFVVRHYQNGVMFREECFPTQDLSTPETTELTKDSE